MVHGVNIRSLRKIWQGLNLPGVPPNDKTDIGAKLHDFVNEKCGCLYLTQKSTLGVKIRNLKVDFKTGGTWRRVGQ